MLQEWPPALRHTTGPLERLLRLTSGLHSGMEHEPVPATVKVAMAEEQRREREAVPQ